MKRVIQAVALASLLFNGLLVAGGSATRSLMCSTRIFPLRQRSSTS